MKKPTFSTTPQFPNDKQITVTRCDGSTYITKQSTHLMNVHGWTASEVRVTQMFKPEPPK